MVIREAVTRSMTSVPSTSVMLTRADASSGGTEYRCPGRRSTPGATPPARWSGPLDRCWPALDATPQWWRESLPRLTVGRGAQPGVSMQPAERVETVLRELDAHVVCQCSLPTLRGSVIGLLNRTLAIAAPRQAIVTDTQ
jgi:hypothetical protein